MSPQGSGLLDSQGHLNKSVGLHKSIGLKGHEPPLLHPSLRYFIPSP